MNEQWKAKWVEALRSGNYTQGHNYLRSKQGFCCLGVAEDIAGATWVKQNDTVCSYEARHGSAHGRSICYLTAAVALTFEIARDPILPWLPINCELPPTLSSLNDDGFTFDQIADCIQYAL